MKSYLFLPDSIKNHVTAFPPVIVVGLPRSGSSFLSDLLSQMDGLYVFDDLYLYREAKAIGANTGKLTPQQTEKLLYFLGWQIRARIRFGTFSVPKMDIDDVEKMNQVLTELFTKNPVSWAEMLEEWMLRLSHNQGSPRWGYKAPQDFLHIEDLKSHFPDAKFIFIQRDPRSMMRSLKYVHDNDGNPKQYHPVAYSLYWKSCAKKIQHMVNTGADHLVVRFEELVSNPEDTGARIADFLTCARPEKFIVREKNTSFSDKERKNLTNTEIWLIEKLLGEQLTISGYDKTEVRPGVGGFVGLLGTTLRFTAYQLRRVLKKKSALVSIKSMLKSIVPVSKT